MIRTPPQHNTTNPPGQCLPKTLAEDIAAIEAAERRIAGKMTFEGWVKHRFAAVSVDEIIEKLMNQLNVGGDNADDVLCLLTECWKAAQENK